MVADPLEDVLQKLIQANSRVEEAIELSVHVPKNKHGRPIIPAMILERARDMVDSAIRCVEHKMKD